MILAIVAIILTIILVVGIHEGGHALFARLFGVKIRRISIGFGKGILSKKDKAGREWTWGVLPLGGYVHLLNSRVEKVTPGEYKYCFDKKPIWQRSVILIAGAGANLFTAFLALLFLYLLGYQQQTPVIQAISPQSIAEKAGLKADERFVAINGQNTSSWQMVGMTLIMNIGKSQVPVSLSDSEGVIHQTHLDLRQWKYKKDDRSLLASLGIKAAPTKLHTEKIAGQSFFPALSAALARLWFLFKFFLIMLKQLITHNIPFSVLLGPLGLFAASIQSFLQGLSVFLYFIANLSLSLALVNLLPIPGLDGGSLIYTLVEKFRGKPVSVAFEILLHQFAVIFFVILLLQLLMNDLQRYL